LLYGSHVNIRVFQGRPFTDAAGRRRMLLLKTWVDLERSDAGQVALLA
jgi:hypothetical protein